MEVARVVIVDDNVDFCRLMGRLVNHLGYEATCLTSGSSAIKYLALHVPELIILDLMMPDIDGLDVLEVVREDQKLKHVPLVIFSAVSDLKLRQRATELGATDWWVKAGVDFTLVARRIVQYLGAPDLLGNEAQSHGPIADLKSDDTSNENSN
ncbi:MAG TPA: response regulator [Tepidisphaeraceae bacterium]|nr:response regulator [Tepidisphaeraceae bacterium]